MKIDNFKSEKRANKKWIASTVHWEDCDHEDYEVYFETDEKFAEDFDSNPHAALSAYLIPALRHGEKRILIDAEICPEFKDSVNTAMSWISHWFYGGSESLCELRRRRSPKYQLHTGLRGPASFSQAGLILWPLYVLTDSTFRWNTRAQSKMGFSHTDLMCDLKKPLTRWLVRYQI